MKCKNGHVTVPLAVIKRLPMYYRHLHLLREKGVERISSQEMAKNMGITPSQLRQDLSAFGEFGQQGIGYRVDTLYLEICEILGLEREYPAVLVGVGNLGKAILNYEGFRKRGLVLKGAFDKEPGLIGAGLGLVPISPITELPSLLVKEKIAVGIIAVPAAEAQGVADSLCLGGVRGIWNFAPRSLLVHPGVKVEDTHIGDGLLQLLYKLKGV